MKWNLSHQISSLSVDVWLNHDYYYSQDWGVDWWGLGCDAWTLIYCDGSCLEKMTVGEMKCLYAWYWRHFALLWRELASLRWYRASRVVYYPIFSLTLSLFDRMHTFACTFHNPKERQSREAWEAIKVRDTRHTCGGPYFFSLFVHLWHLLPMNAAIMLQYSQAEG